MLQNFNDNTFKLLAVLNINAFKMMKGNGDLR